VVELKHQYIIFLSGERMGRANFYEVTYQTRFINASCIPVVKTERCQAELAEASCSCQQTSSRQYLLFFVFQGLPKGHPALVEGLS
jgi:hypothetical protein